MKKIVFYALAKHVTEGKKDIVKALNDRQCDTSSLYREAKHMSKSKGYELTYKEFKSLLKSLVSAKLVCFNVEEYFYNGKQKAFRYSFTKKGIQVLLKEVKKDKKQLSN
ncbi:hypothetical protein PQ478_08650 [Alkalihalophilus pseudofirmus]|uniref:hypothetical protein n=1 Tax=Alkalihalophilus pseudofirmus TaxID=79885 RepID=UPI00259B6EFE|nr:hypothetical protein [Alkalihalophilus pseudofirmus]WEG18538.1 hypothetical protein PQ478_08650 [Alkalihalophilus pseudofirmus]